MRKILISILLVLALAMPTFAANESVTETVTYAGDLVIITWSCVGDDADGDITNTATTTMATDIIKGMYLRSVEADPGSTAPTVDTDIDINDANGLDVLNSNGTDLLHNTATQSTVPNRDGQNMSVAVTSALTLVVAAEQAVNSATYDVILTFSPEP